MTTDDGATFYYYKEPDRLRPGVTSGYVVIWDGQAGDAVIIPAASLVEDDGGGGTIVVTGDARPGRVVNDSPER